MEQKILLVEDEPQTRQAIQTVLGAKGWRALAADSVAVGWHLFTSEQPDLTIIDLGLPDGSGLDLCKKIRDHKELRHTPVIILTAKGEYETKVSGFAAGADQYLVKPVSPQELALWAEALLRRLVYDKEEGDVLSAGGCSIDLQAHLVRYKDETIPYLTVKEFELLYFLVKKRPQVLSRKYILSHLWHTIAVDHVVDTHLTNLRHKLPRELADKIQTVPGKGFRFLE